MRRGAKSKPPRVIDDGAAYYWRRLTDTVSAVGCEKVASATSTFKAADRVETVVFTASVVHQTFVHVSIQQQH